MIDEISPLSLNFFTSWLNENGLEFFSCLLASNPMDTQNQQVRVNRNIEFLRRKQQEAYALLALLADQLVQENPTQNARASE